MLENYSKLYIEKKIMSNKDINATFVTGLIPVNEINPMNYSDEYGTVAVRYAIKKHILNTIETKYITGWIFFGRRITFNELQTCCKGKPYYKYAFYLMKRMPLLNICKKQNGIYLMNINDMTVKEFENVYLDVNYLTRVRKSF